MNNLIYILNCFVAIIFFHCFATRNLSNEKYESRNVKYIDLYGNYIKFDSGKPSIVADKKIIIKDKKTKTSFIKLFTKPLAIPKNVEPVKNFNIKLYLGKWYEIARLDHSFEKNLKNTYTVYTYLNPDKIKIQNFGVKYKGQIKSIKGSAKFINKQNKDIGHLKATFFKPFYGSYVIFYLEKEDPNDKNSKYKYAIVCGSTHEYCWILSRTKNIDKKTKTKLMKFAKSKGFNIKNFIFPWEY
ncbi:MAG: hypothetical protein GY830_06380 [Bacteroidetes bacterium]|nr:hypothetical protein [Bacteroidota bacterium]